METWQRLLRKAVEVVQRKGPEIWDDTEFTYFVLDSFVEFVKTRPEATNEHIRTVETVTAHYKKHYAQKIEVD